MSIFPNIPPELRAYQRGLQVGRVDAAAEIKRLREALEFVKSDLEHCDWCCPRCFRDYGMRDTDIYSTVRDALKQPERPALTVVNEIR